MLVSYVPFATLELPIVYSDSVDYGKQHELGEPLSSPGPSKPPGLSVPAQPVIVAPKEMQHLPPVVDVCPRGELTVATSKTVSAGVLSCIDEYEV